jgi:poly-beta-1,6-N-acetyl-D-glucosamine synthase
VEQILSQSTNYELALFAILSISFLIQMFYYLFVYIRVANARPKKMRPIGQNMPPVSVIICARNEEDNLRELLPSILEQDYPSFEVVVVNDCSSEFYGKVQLPEIHHN